jgi:hypothetical protein
MGDMVRGCGLDLDLEARKLIGVALLNEARELRCAGLLDFFDVEAAALLAEPQHALDFVLFGLVEVAPELFQFAAVAAIEGSEPSRELFSRRSLGNFRCGGRGLRHSDWSGAKGKPGEGESDQGK